MAIYKKALNGLKSDASLLRAYANGDASAFDTLYGRYKDQLFHYLCHQVDLQTSAEEIAQEVWMAVIRGAETFQDQSADNANITSSFRSWLFSIAHRRSADYWRQKYRRIKEQETFEQDLSEISDPIGDPEKTLSLFDQLRKGLFSLPDEQRQSFLLKEEGFSYKEIAAITDTGTETVKSRLRYAKQSLQELLGGEND